MSLRVLVSDSLAEEGLDVFRNAKGIEVDVETSLSPEELRAAAALTSAWCFRRV